MCVNNHSRYDTLSNPTLHRHNGAPPVLIVRMFPSPNNDPTKIEVASVVRYSDDNIEGVSRDPILEYNPTPYGTKAVQWLLGNIEVKVREPKKIVTSLG